MYKPMIFHFHQIQIKKSDKNRNSEYWNPSQFDKLEVEYNYWWILSIKLYFCEILNSDFINFYNNNN